MVEACRASARRPCEIVESISADSDAVARVAWKSTERLQAVVRVGLGHGDRRRWEVREIEFKSDDDLAERWRSVGLIIGAVATFDAPALAPAVQPEPPRAAPMVSRAPVDDAVKKTTRHVWLDAGVVGGPALDKGRWRAGVWIGAAWVPLRIPAAIVASVRYERRFSDAGDFDLSLSSGSLGLLGFADLGPFAIEGRVEVMRRILVLSAADDATGVSETHHRWETGARAGGDVVVRLGGTRFSAVGGADATYAWGATEIAVRGQPVGRLPTVVGSALLGLRWKLEGAP